MNSENVKSLLVNVYRDLKRGEITESRATKEAFILGNILKVIQIYDLENRLAEIEKTIRFTGK